MVVCETIFLRFSQNFLSKARLKNSQRQPPLIHKVSNIGKLSSSKNIARNGIWISNLCIVSRTQVLLANFKLLRPLYKSTHAQLILVKFYHLNAKSKLVNQRIS